MKTESHQYQLLRIGASIAMLATFAVVVWLSSRAVPIIQQAFWPATLGCGCGVVALAIPPLATFTASAVVVISTVLTGRFAFFLIGHLRRSRTMKQRWTMRGYRTVFQHSIQETITIVRRTGRQAMTIGLFRPQIYITEDLVTSLRRSELDAVLRHEQAHRRRFDQLWSAVLDSFSAALWRVPMIQQLVAANLTLRELAADASATGGYRRTTGLTGAILALSSIEAMPDVASFSPNLDRVEKLLNHEWRPKLALWRWSYAVGILAIGLGISAVIRLTPPAVATVSPTIASVCRETRLLCPRLQVVQTPVFYQQSIPQSVYVVPSFSSQ